MTGKASDATTHDETAQTAMVEARGVEKEYVAGGASLRALRGVDLSIPRGEMVAVMGPPGCGKTTLLNCLSGLDELSGGEVSVEGEPISGTLIDNIREGFPGMEYRVPWAALVIVAGYAASLLITYLPARGASSIYPAEALRYE